MGRFESDNANLNLLTDTAKLETDNFLHESWYLGV